MASARIIAYWESRTDKKWLESKRTVTFYQKNMYEQKLLVLKKQGCKKREEDKWSCILC